MGPFNLQAIPEIYRLENQTCDPCWIFNVLELIWFFLCKRPFKIANYSSTFFTLRNKKAWKIMNTLHSCPSIFDSPLISSPKFEEHFSFTKSPLMLLSGVHHLNRFPAFGQKRIFFRSPTWWPVGGLGRRELRCLVRCPCGGFWFVPSDILHRLTSEVKQILRRLRDAGKCWGVARPQSQISLGGFWYFLKRYLFYWLIQNGSWRVWCTWADEINYFESSAGHFLLLVSLGSCLKLEKGYCWILRCYQWLDTEQ